MTPLHPGQRLGGKYEVERLIGRGGFGAVYVAIQHPVQRRVAIKVIKPERADDPGLAERFFREAKSISSLRHGSTVTLHDYGVEGERLYMVMEYIDGTELSRLIRTEGPLAPGRVAHLAIQAAGALAEAHQMQIVHRDIKPANMMVTQSALGDEELKLLDFGIARLLGPADDTRVTRTGLVVGTPSYMAPEQILGRGIGPWTDQYALGVVMFQMLVGRRPFEAPSTVEVLDAHRHRPVPRMPPALGVPAALETIVRRAMSKRPEDRFPDMASMARALRALALDPPDDTCAAPPLQEKSTALGVPMPDLDASWTTGPTSLEMRGSVDDAPRRPARGQGLAWISLAVVVGVAMSLVLVLSQSDLGPPPAEPPERISLGSARLPDASQVMPAPDAAPEVVDAAVDAVVDTAPPPPKKLSKSRKRRAAPRVAPRPVVTPVETPIAKPVQPSPRTPARLEQRPAPQKEPTGEERWQQFGLEP